MTIRDNGTIGLVYTNKLLSKKIATPITTMKKP